MNSPFIDSSIVPKARSNRTPGCVESFPPARLPSPKPSMNTVTMIVTDSIFTTAFIPEDHLHRFGIPTHEVVQSAHKLPNRQGGISANNHFGIDPHLIVSILLRRRRQDGAPCLTTASSATRRVAPFRPKAAPAIRRSRRRYFGLSVAVFNKETQSPWLGFSARNQSSADMAGSPYVTAVASYLNAPS